MLNQYNKGVTLVELMLAMVIGIVILGGVMSLFISSRDTQRVSEDQVQLASDSRFVMETIGYDLKHAGVFGPNNMPATLVCGPYNVCPTALPLAVADCANGWYIDLDLPMVASNDSAMIDGADYSTSCASNGYKAGTDILGVHYADPAKLTDTLLAANVAYVRSNTTGGGLFVGSTIPDYKDLTKLWEAQHSWHPVANPEGPTSNHKLVGHLYYVSDYTDVVGDGIPSLRRTELGEGPAMTDAVLLSGVEDMQLQFGITTANNPAEAPFADTYVNASNIPVIP
ncbi:MAG: PilW family protein, partial [Gammaproteobacteria bacterium]